MIRHYIHDGVPKVYSIGCRQHTFSEQYSGGGVKSGYTSHTKPALFVSGITMGGFWNIPGRIVKEGEEALRTAKRLKDKKRTIWTDGPRLNDGK